MPICLISTLKLPVDFSICKFLLLEDAKDIIRQVREAGMLCGITIKPKTPVSAIADLIPLLYFCEMVVKV